MFRKQLTIFERSFQTFRKRFKDFEDVLRTLKNKFRKILETLSKLLDFFRNVFRSLKSLKILKTKIPWKLNFVRDRWAEVFTIVLVWFPRTELWNFKKSKWLLQTFLQFYCLSNYFRTPLYLSATVFLWIVFSSRKWLIYINTRRNLGAV